MSNPEENNDPAASIRTSYTSSRSAVFSARVRSSRSLRLMALRFSRRVSMMRGGAIKDIVEISQWRHPF